MKRSKNPRARIQTVIEKAKAQSSENKPEAFNTWTSATLLSLELVSPDFCLTQYCLNNVGKSLVDQGDYERAIGVLEPALEKAREALGLAHPLVEHPCQSLGRAYDAVGDYAKSLQYWDAAAHSAENTRGIYHASTIFCLSKKARALRSQGMYEEALTVYCKVLGRTQFVFGNELQTAFAARELAACYCQLGRFQEAIPIWQHARHCFDAHPRYHRYAKTVKRCLCWSRDQVAQSGHAGSNAGRTDEVVSDVEVV